MMQSAPKRTLTIGAGVALAIAAVAALRATDAMAIPPTIPQLPPVVVLPPPAASSAAPRRRPIARPPLTTPTVDPNLLAAARKAFASAPKYTPQVADLAFPLAVTDHYFTSTVKPNPQPDYAGGKQTAIVAFYDASIVAEGEVLFAIPPSAPLGGSMNISYWYFYAVGQPVMLDCRFSLFIPRNDLKLTVDWGPNPVSVPIIGERAVVTFAVPSVHFNVTFTLPRLGPSNIGFKSCTLSPVY